MQAYIYLALPLKVYRARPELVHEYYTFNSDISFVKSCCLLILFKPAGKGSSKTMSEKKKSYSLKRAKFTQLLTAEDEKDILSNPTGTLKLFTGNISAVINKIIFMAQCPQMRAAVRALPAPGEELDVSSYTMDGSILGKAVGLLKGHKIPVILGIGEDAEVIQLKNLMERWMGEGSELTVKMDFTPGQFNNYQPLPTRMKFRTPGIQYLRYLSSSDGPNILMEAHGMKLMCTKYDLVSRCPGLFEEIISSAGPTAHLNVTKEVSDKETFELVMAIVQGVHVEVSEEYSGRVYGVLRKWASDSENLKTTTVEDLTSSLEGVRI